MKHFQSKVLTAAILAALSGSAIAADVYEKSEVYTKSEVGNEITKAKTEVTTDLESKITAAKTELETKLTAQNESGKADIKKIKTAVGNIAKLLHGEEGNEENLGIVKSIETLNSSVTENQSDIDNLYSNLEETNNALDANTNALNEATGQFDTFAKETVKEIKAINNRLDEASESVNDSLEAIDNKADTALSIADEAKQIAEDTKNSVNDNVKAAKDAASEAKTSAGEAKKAAEKVTDIEEAAEVALVAAHKNTQDIHGFEEGDIIYKKDKNGKITEKEATAADVEADEFKGMGLKGIVAEHDESLDKLTETVNENSDALVKTAGVINEISTDVKANKAAIEENKAAITKKADQTALDAVSDKVTANETAIGKKADKTALDAVSDKVTANETAIGKKADKTALDAVSDKVTANETAIGKKANSTDVYTKDKVYTKEESDNKFVKINDSIGGLNTTTNGLETRLAAAEKSVADHGTRLDSAEKSITEHGTRLNGLDKAVSDLRKETRQGLAEQAALSGLFQPYNVGRFNVTAAVGGYKSESAVAIGTGFRFTENFAAKAGVAVGTSSGSSAAYHVGVNYEW